MASSLPIRLIPWDPDSEDHIDRITKQRISCGWDADKVPKWKETQRSGHKCLFWISVSTEKSEPDSEEKRQELIQLLPKDQKPLLDTCPSLRGTPRTPTEQLFHALGHISLDTVNPGADKVNLDISKDGLYWIKTFYIEHAFRSQGVGRAAMDIVESMATSEPLCARTLGLDTVSTQTSYNLAESRGEERPKTTNQEWYTRRGYDLLLEVDNLYEPPEGETYPEMKAVFMKKEIA